MIVIAHLSDVHVDDARSVERTRAVAGYLQGLPYELDAVVVTGDIADHGLAQEYEVARELLELRHPTFVCPGNHDERDAFRRHLLGRESGSGPINQVHRGDGFVLALCDSSVPGKDHGELDEETLGWLEYVLAGTPGDTPVIVGFHHPPVPLHVPYVDGIRLFGEERLAELAERYPRLVAFLVGHAHTAAASSFAGRPVLVAPGVVSTVRLPWEPGDGVVRLDEPPALAFHVLDEGGLTTHFRVVTPEAGPGLGR
ncbi:metallophosphoesterase [Spirillospora sp. NPDC047279]|uniref:metallophosphoesterase n=1 Tax=Spirillospora sp. NPDC047279 TaxID=3155478 RepID=UPI0034095971